MPPLTGYYRHPAVSGNSITFVCDDDLWTVSADGGVARRLTANPGTVSFPVYAPDGKRIAFTGRDDGPTEVYVMDAEGGPPRRLTWLGGMTQVVGWTPSGAEILCASDWRQPFRGFMHLYAIPHKEGPPRPLNHGPARAISYQAGGPGVVIGRNSGDPARWKRYRGGTAGTLWIDRGGDGSFVPLIRLAGNLASPMWIGSRIYFLSDHEGYGNLYSCTVTGRGVKRHTHHEDYYVRFPSSDGRRIAYHAGADLYIFDPAGDVEHKLDVRLASSLSQRSRKFASASRHLESFDLHPKGHAVNVVSRGGLFTMGLWEGAATRVGVPSKARYRLARWLPDGKRIVAVTDERGEEELVLFGESTAEQPKRIRGDFGRSVDLAVAPAGSGQLALTNQRQEIILIDLQTGRSKTLERSQYSRIDGLAWSADGRWLAYGFADSRRTCCIHLYDTASRKISPITRSDFRDVRPSFDPDGKYLYFVSWRVFDPVYDSQCFDLGFPKGAQPFLIPLRRDIVSPFALATRPLRAPGAPASGEKGEQEKKDPGKKPASKEAAEEPPKVEIDLEGIADRIVAFPVPEGRYGAVLGARGRAFFSSFPVEGSLEQSWLSLGEPPAKGRLEVYDFEQAKTETVQEKITDFTLSMEAKVLGIRVGNRIRALPVTFKADQKPAAEGANRETGWLDLERLRLSVVPEDEWKQMFHEAWRLQRDQFWTPDMSGIDWKAIHNRYLPLVGRVATRAEFSDLLWEMQGELGTSHCYELGGDYRPEPMWFQGFLGADLALDARAGTWRIARIKRGDSWDEKRSSPLAAPGLNIQEGDEILAVGGESVGREVSPDERLVNYAGHDVQLTIRPRSRVRTGRANPKRVVTIKTLKDEYALRYREWVETNRTRVHAETNGRVGYIHIPDMGPSGYSEFHRYYLSEMDREGLVIDARWNLGGHVSQLLLEKLIRRRVGYDATRWGAPEPYPSDAPMGPMVALTNEYAGSDGDIFSHCFKLYGLGPLIGKRTWGGVVGIWPRHALADGTWTTQPEFAFWFKDVGWAVENYGTDPDIEVEVRPQDYAAMADPQLDRALAEIRRILRAQRPRVPEFKGRPTRRPGRLPR